MATQQATETMTLPPAAERVERLGRYHILREIGRGAMSLVYEARDPDSRRNVALKVLHVPPTLAPEQAEAMLARFEREARAVAGLSHPNIVAIHAFGREPGPEGDRHFLVLDYLEGETLRARLDRGILTPAQAAEILPQIASAVDAVHAQGVVHRDIKPSNVMLLPDGTAKLLDFGVARQSDDSTVTGTGALVGSSAYMSPEQVRGEPGSNASDIWALGALLYEMLAGHPPFQGSTIPSVLYQVTHAPPAPVVGVPTPVQRVLRRALQKNPARRYSTATALADAFGRALPGAPVFQRSTSTRAWRWAPLLLVPVALGIGLVRLTERHPALPGHSAPSAVSAPSAHAQPEAMPTIHIYENTPPAPARPQRAASAPRFSHAEHRTAELPLHARRPQALPAVAQAKTTSAATAKSVTASVPTKRAPAKKTSASFTPRKVASLAAPRFLHRDDRAADDGPFQPVPRRRVFRGASGAWYPPEGFRRHRRHVFRGAAGPWVGSSGDDDYNQKETDKLNKFIYSPDAP